MSRPSYAEHRGVGARKALPEHAYRAKAIARAEEIQEDREEKLLRLATSWAAIIGGLGIVLVSAAATSPEGIKSGAGLMVGGFTALAGMILAVAAELKPIRDV